MAWNVTSSVESAAKAIGRKPSEVQKWIDAFVQNRFSWLCRYRYKNGRPPSKSQRKRALLPLFPLLSDDKELLQSEFPHIIGILHELTSHEEDILESIEADLDEHGMKKKRKRGSEAPLGEGRPRIPAFLLLVMLVIRGWYGGMKNAKVLTLIGESITMRDLRENLGLKKFPRPSTLNETLNAISNETRKEIHEKLLRFIKKIEGCEDFREICADSTACKSMSEYPSDSGMMKKFAAKARQNIVKLWKKGYVEKEEDILEELKKECEELEKDHYRISTLESASGKEGKKAKSKVEKRKELYGEMYKKALQLNNKIMVLSGKYRKKIEELEGKEKSEGEKILHEIDTQINHQLTLVGASRKRVLEGKYPDAKGRPHSISDPDAWFIVKGGREKIFGYKPQLSFSEKGFVTAIVVPKGNAADSIMLVELLKESTKNTGIIPEVVSVDDGYSSEKNVKEIKEMGVKIVSISGSKGKKLLLEYWEEEEYKHARRIRNRAESGIGVLKEGYDFGECSRAGLEEVRGEMYEKVISYNIRKIVKLRGKKAA